MMVTSDRSGTVKEVLYHRWAVLSRAPVPVLTSMPGVST